MCGKSSPSQAVRRRGGQHKARPLLPICASFPSRRKRHIAYFALFKTSLTELVFPPFFMGLAPSRMSANPALIPDSKTASTTSASASVSPEADSDSAFTNPTTITNPSGGQASAPVVLTQAKAAAVAEDAMSSAPKLDKGKGKQKAILEKEDGEISEEEEYRIPTGDSWRPPQHPKRDRSPQSFQSNSHQRRRSSQSFKPGYTSFGKKPRRDSRTALPHGAAAHPDRSSLSRSPDTTTNPLLTNKHDRRVSDVSRAASSSTSISPESNSLSLPDSELSFPLVMSRHDD